MIGQARRVLFPPDSSKHQTQLLISAASARKACESLIMRQATDPHARSLRHPTI